MSKRKPCPYELKPCPFCGGKDVRLKKGLPYRQSQGITMRLVQCHNCGCKTKVFYQDAFEPIEAVEQAAVEAWNSRAGERHAHILQRFGHDYCSLCGVAVDGCDDYCNTCGARFDEEAADE